MSHAAAYRPAYDSPTVLVISPDRALREEVIRGLQTESGLIEQASGGADALAKLETGRCRVVLLDRSLPDIIPEDFERQVARKFPNVEVVPIDHVSRKDSPKNENLPSPPLTTTISSSSEETCRLPGVIGASVAMQRVGSLARRVAPKRSTVLLTGETGTGKEVIAKAIHALSPRSGRPMVTVNCAAIPEALLESELFGHTRGAFTGAVQSQVGRIHAAQGGTLLLDEIGDIPMSLQAKLLRFLESGEVQRLGSSDVFRLDVRVIAATNANLALRIAEKQFREDLYYRLAVFPITLPPLRERGNDVLLLAESFLHEFCGARARFADDARAWLLKNAWRGNVRELRHCIERASVLWTGEGEVGSAELNFQG